MTLKKIRRKRALYDLVNSKPASYLQNVPTCPLACTRRQCTFTRGGIGRGNREIQLCNISGGDVNLPKYSMHNQKLNINPNFKLTISEHQIQSFYIFKCVAHLRIINEKLNTFNKSNIKFNITEIIKFKPNKPLNLKKIIDFKFHI